MKIFDAIKQRRRTRNLTAIVSDLGEDIVEGKHVSILSHIFAGAKDTSTLIVMFLFVVGTYPIMGKEAMPVS